MKSAFMPSLMPGIYLGFTLIIFTLLIFVLDVGMESPIKYVSYAILAIGLYLSIIDPSSNDHLIILRFLNLFSTLKALCAEQSSSNHM